MRKLLKIGVLALLLVGGAAHLFYWYWPRERAAAPEGLPARLLASGEYAACLWIPYPHQNLGVLSSSIDDGPTYVAALSRVAGLSSTPSTPSFGPFAVPPSREVVACSDLDGSRFLVVARVYPGIALLARTAGKLADNPWLEGGEVRETRGRRDEVEERVLQVSWQEGYWMVRSGGPAPRIPDVGPGTPLPASLGLLRLDREASDLPPGDYVLTRKEGGAGGLPGDLVVELAGGGEPPEPALATGSDAPVLLAVAGPAWPAESPRPLSPAALALFEEGGATLSPFGVLPGVAVLNPPGGRRWALPTRGLAGLLAGNLPHGNAAGWGIVALDTRSLERAQALAPQVSALVPPDESGSDGRLVLGVWMRPHAARRLITQMRQGLEKVPLVDKSQVQRWRDWETLLEPIDSCRQASLAAVRSPSAFRLRLHGC